MNLHLPLISPALALALTTIGFGVGCGSGSNGKVVANTAVLTSTTTDALASRATASSVALTNCTNSSTRCTPQNLSGDLCYAILGLGALGGDFFSMTWLAPASTFPDGPTSGTCSSTTFSLLDSTQFSGSVKIPSSESEMPSSQNIIRTELMFNYVDAQVGISGVSGITDGTYIIRTVYASTATATDVTGTMEKGDKLYRLSSESKFKWCNSTTCSETRSDVATGILQDSTVTGYVFPGQGNSSYVNVTANFSSPVAVTYSSLQDTSKTWRLTFDLSDAIVWSANLSAYTNVRALLAGFRLKFGPNQSTTQGETDDGIQATLRIQ